MARVFKIPTYTDQAGYKLFALGCQDDYRVKDAFDDGLLGFPRDSAVAMMIEAGVVPTELAKCLDRAYDVGMSSKDESAVAYAQAVQAVMRLARSRNLTMVSDDLAVFELFGKYLRAEVKIVAAATQSWISADKKSRKVALSGIVASFATASTAAQRLAALKGFKSLTNLDPNIANMMCVADTYRYGLFSSKAGKHIRSVAMDEATIDVKELRVDIGGWFKAHPDLEAYSVAGLTVVMDSERYYVLDRARRDQMADVMHSLGGGLMYAMNYQGGADSTQAVSVVQRSIKYIRDSIQSCKGIQVRHIARHMKGCYAVMLAKYGRKDMRPAELAFATKQEDELRLAAKDSAVGFDSFMPILDSWPDRLAIDFGTCWNYLPGVDVDLCSLDTSAQKQMNAERAPNLDAWADFMQYSRGVISAHVITKRPDTPGIWAGADAGVDPEQEIWVKSCRAGKLHYPPRNCKMYITKCIPWVDRTENWFYKADDVTHVHANAEYYKDLESIAGLKDSDTNELLYAMQHAPMLSKNVTPAAARAAWAKGKPKGDCVLLYAGKNESTKPAPKERGTASQDDIRREHHSEIDYNFAALASLFDGVCAKMDRKTMELKIGGLIAVRSDDVILIALDVTGWSPNAPRLQHYGFLDMLMGFYTGIDGCKASSLFDDVNIINARRGHYSNWKAMDGTMQGFTGLGDSILHSLIAQWSFVRAREAGLFKVGSKIMKVAMIDDILIRLSAQGSKPDQAFECIAMHYRELGYTPDSIKTLLAHHKGHFLNRLYSKGFEVVTASKIFARANRSYESQYPSVWELVDSILAGYLGASDRGACSYVCYTLAIWRSIVVMIGFGLRSSYEKQSYELVHAWVPRVLGGHGIPIYSQWVTRECSDTMTSGLGAVVTISRSFAISDMVLSLSILRMLAGYTSQKLEARGSLETMDDPYTVRVKGLSDPKSVSRHLSKVGSEKALKSPPLIRLSKSVSSSQYRAMVDAFLDSYTYPAPLLMSIASSLPHTLANKLSVKLTTSEVTIKYCTFKQRREGNETLRERNCTALNHFINVVPNAVIDPLDLRSGSDMAVTLREKSFALASYNATYLATTSALDCIGQVVEDGSILVNIPAYTNEKLYEGLGSGFGKRTHVNKPMFQIHGVVNVSSDPVHDAIIAALRTHAIAQAMHIDTTMIDKLFCQAWIGMGYTLKMPTISVTGTNPRRGVIGLARNSYTVCGFPNSANSVMVNANKVITDFDVVHVGLDFLSVIYSLKASALVDMEMGAVNQSGSVRQYAVRATRNFICSSVNTQKAHDCNLPAFKGAGMSPESFIKVIQMVAGACFPGNSDTNEEDQVERSNLDDKLLIAWMNQQFCVVSPDAVLNAMDPGKNLESRTIFPLAFLTPQKGSKFKRGHADVLDVARDAIPIKIAKKLTTNETLVAQALKDAVSSLLLVERKDEMHPVRNAIKALVNRDLCSILDRWQLKRIYNDLIGDDVQKFREATRLILRCMQGDKQVLNTNMEQYWKTAAMGHISRIENKSLPVHRRGKSAVKNRVLDAWAECVGQQLHAIIARTVHAIVAGVVLVMKYPRTDEELSAARSGLSVLFTAGPLKSEVWSTAATRVLKHHLLLKDKHMSWMKEALTDIRSWFCIDIVYPMSTAEHAQQRFTTTATDKSAIIPPVLLSCGKVVAELNEPLPAWLVTMDNKAYNTRLRMLGREGTMDKHAAYNMFADALKVSNEEDEPSSDIW